MPWSPIPCLVLFDNIFAFGTNVVGFLWMEPLVMQSESDYC
jgi:hypothetical protein